MPALCNHCDDAPCIKAVPEAIRKRDDGIVIVDPTASKGRKDLVKACPYGAIVWNEEAQVPQNWTFDAHLLDQGWKEPRCAHSCPTDVFQAVKAEPEAMARRIAAEKLEELRPELKTKPRVLYKNLSRVKTYFIGGSVIGKVKGVKECLEGAEVVLAIGDQTVAKTHTDAFGDFKFDGLTEASGLYSLTIAKSGFAPGKAVATAGATTFLGEMELGS